MFLNTSLHSICKKGRETSTPLRKDCLLSIPAKISLYSFLMCYRLPTHSCVEMSWSSFYNYLFIETILIFIYMYIIITMIVGRPYIDQPLSGIKILGDKIYFHRQIILSKKMIHRVILWDMQTKTNTRNVKWQTFLCFCTSPFYSFIVSSFILKVVSSFNHLNIYSIM